MTYDISFNPVSRNGRISLGDEARSFHAIPLEGDWCVYPGSVPGERAMDAILDYLRKAYPLSGGQDPKAYVEGRVGRRMTADTLRTVTADRDACARLGEDLPCFEAKARAQGWIIAPDEHNYQISAGEMAIMHSDPLYSDSTYHPTPAGWELCCREDGIKIDPAPPQAYHRVSPRLADRLIVLGERVVDVKGNDGGVLNIWARAEAGPVAGEDAIRKAMSSDLDDVRIACGHEERSVSVEMAATLIRRGIIRDSGSADLPFCEFVPGPGYESRRMLDAEIETVEDLETPGPP